MWIRAIDVAGNVGQAGPFEVYAAEGEPVGGYTEQIDPPALLWPRVALLIAAVGVEIVVTVGLGNRPVKADAAAGKRQKRRPTAGR